RTEDGKGTSCRAAGGLHVSRVLTQRPAGPDDGRPMSPPLDPFARVTDRASIYEVSPRDGLQNEAALIPLEGKRRLIEALVASGLKRVEITSFVSPKWVPQLADAEDLAREMKPPPGVTYSALVPNARGLERALEVGLKEIAVFLS